MNTVWVALYCYAGTVGIVLVTIAMVSALLREFRMSARSGSELFPEEDTPLQTKVQKNDTPAN